MPYTTVCGLRIHYEVTGSGPPVLFLAPGGFDSSIRTWRSPRTVWGEIDPIETLAGQYTCIAYDRRESGESGGRVEAITWQSYAAEARGLIDHLGIDKVAVVAACMSCSVAIRFAVAFPDAAARLLLHRPTGGPHWRIAALSRFAEHIAHVRRRGLASVVAAASRAWAETQPGDLERRFWNVPEAGPWIATIGRDAEFARRFAAQDPERYAALALCMGRSLFDRDSVAGAEPEALMALDTPALIISGDDSFHPHSAAHYLHECLGRSRLIDVPLAEHTADMVLEQTRDFLGGTRQ